MKYYMQKYKIPATTQEILPVKMANMLLDAAVTAGPPGIHNNTDQKNDDITPDPPNTNNLHLKHTR